MRFKRFLMAAGVALLAPPAVAGDVYIAPECSEDAYVVSLWARKGSHVMFSESLEGVGPLTMVAAQCNTRSAVGYKDEDDETRAADILLQVVKSQGDLSMRAARQKIDALGLAPKTLTLSRTHCACDLFFRPQDDAFINPAHPQ